MTVSEIIGASGTEVTGAGVQQKPRDLLLRVRQEELKVMFWKLKPIPRGLLGTRGAALQGAAASAGA